MPFSWLAHSHDNVCDGTWRAQACRKEKKKKKRQNNVLIISAGVDRGPFLNILTLRQLYDSSSIIRLLIIAIHRFGITDICF